MRRQDREHCASITCMIRHYVARRAKVIEDHPHNAEKRMGSVRQPTHADMPSDDAAVTALFTVTARWYCAEALGAPLEVVICRGDWAAGLPLFYCCGQEQGGAQGSLIDELLGRELCRGVRGRIAGAGTSGLASGLDASRIVCRV